MRRKDEDSCESSLLRAIDKMARENGCSIAALIQSDEFAEEVSRRARDVAESPIRKFGFRAQDMFAYVVAAIGGVSLINEEDQGLFFEGSGNLIRPDFRIITEEGEHLLVEVKNFRSKGGLSPRVFKSEYLRDLSAYGEKMGLPVKIAIYWVGWGCWTLTDLSWFPSVDEKSEISFQAAVLNNEMYLLGDFQLGAEYPLALRIHSDPENPGSLSESGNTEFTIGQITHHVAGVEITEDLEKKIASLLMFHGRWTDIRRPAKVVDGVLEYFDFSVQPEEVNEAQEFEIVGAMSELISNQYLYSTSDGTEVTSLAPKCDVSDLGVMIPKDYQGKALKLWRLQVRRQSCPTGVSRIPRIRLTAR